MASSRKVQVTINNQFIVTIPKTFAEILSYKQGTPIEFSIDNGLILTKTAHAAKSTRRKVQVTNNNQYIITIPKVFAELLNYKQGKKVIFTLDKKMNLVIK